MIRVLYLSPDGHMRFDLEPEEFATALKDGESQLWVDFSNETAEVCAPIMRDTFGFHPLAVEDALEESHVPKVDDWEQYVYVVLHAVQFDQKSEDHLSTLELDVFLGKNYLVTFQTTPISAVAQVWRTCLRDERHIRRGVSHLLYQLADGLVNDYMPVVEAIDEAIDDIEDRIFGGPEGSLLESIFRLKRALLHLRRIIIPQREVLNKLARNDYEAIASHERVFFRDVYDHLVRMHDFSESLRDLIGGALDTYLSVLSNRMNSVMKVLAVITTLFMPVSFLSGFFGMNFFHPVAPLEIWTDLNVFWLLLALVILLPSGMYLWLRRRAWI